MTRRVETIGDATLYQGDCREILPTIGKVGAIVTDPPYGIGAKLASGGRREWPLHNKGELAWDMGEVPSDVVEALPGLAPAIIWGGHLYRLPAARGWLVWDKVVRNFDSGHCELAWTTLDQPVRAFNQATYILTAPFEGKHHPTQKPNGLMRWCLEFLPDAAVVLDPFMGSGTTGVACAQIGRSFIGIEREARYFDVACRRIEEAYRQPRLFDEPTTKPVQGSLFGDDAGRAALEQGS